MKTKEWKNKTLSMKILTIIGLIISIAIIVLALLQIFDIWDTSIKIFEPLTGVLMLIQSIENWKTERKLAIFSLITAIFLFATSVFIWLRY